MKTNRTREQLIKYVTEEVKHNEKMCKIANNDYDIDYWDARAIIAQNILDELNKDTNFHIERYLNSVMRKGHAEVKQEADDFWNENQFESVTFRGYIDEYEMLFMIFRQEYC